MQIVSKTRNILFQQSQMILTVRRSGASNEDSLVCFRFLLAPITASSIQEVMQ